MTCFGTSQSFLAHLCHPHGRLSSWCVELRSCLLALLPPFSLMTAFAKPWSKSKAQQWHSNFFISRSISEKSNCCSLLTTPLFSSSGSTCWFTRPRCSKSWWYVHMYACAPPSKIANPLFGYSAVTGTLLLNLPRNHLFRVILRSRQQTSRIA